jgi:hypothetical protein
VAAHRIDRVTPGEGPGSGQDGGPAPASCVVLTPESSRLDRERASRALVPLLAGWCGRLARQLQLDQVYVACCSEADALRGEDAARTRSEQSELRRARRYVLRIGAQPLPHARRQVSTLVGLVRQAPFEKVTITADLVLVLVPADSGRIDSGLGAPIEIGLPRGQSGRFPVFIRTIPGVDSPASAAFMRLLGHGRCWGEAEPMIEAAAERLDLCALVLAALAWARRNL